MEKSKTEIQIVGLLAFGLLVASCLGFSSLPIPGFYREWPLSVFLSLSFLFLAAKVGGVRLEFRFTGLSLAAAAVMVAASGQILFGHGDAGTGFFYVSYGIAFLASVVLGRFLLAASLSFYSRLSLVFLCCSFFLALVAAFQVTDSFGDGYLVLGRVGGRVYGNLAQANLFADFMVLGLISLAFLYASGQIRTVFFIAATLLLGEFVVLSGARVSWVYAGIMFCASVALYARKGLKRPADIYRFARALGFVACALAGLWLVSGFVDVLALLSGRGADSLTERSATSTPLRLWFWKMAWIAGLEHPFAGVGAGGYVGFSSLQALLLPGVPPAGADINAHNLFLHVLAEFGFPVALIVVVASCCWGVRSLRVLMTSSVERVAALLGVFVLMAHSLVEFPLWYFYLIVPFGLLVGCVESDENNGGKSLVFEAKGCFLLAVSGLLISLYTYFAYIPVRDAMSRIVELVMYGAPPKYDAAVQEALARGALNSFPFGKYADSIRVISEVPTKETVDGVLRRCLETERFAPSPYLLSRCTAAALIVRDVQKADYFAVRLCKMYPSSVQLLATDFSLAGVAAEDVLRMQAECVRSSISVGKPAADLGG